MFALVGFIPPGCGSDDAPASASGTGGGTAGGGGTVGGGATAGSGGKAEQDAARPDAPSTDGALRPDTGSSTDSAPPLPPIGTFEEYADAYARATCSAVARCCSAGFDEASCIVEQRDAMLARRINFSRGTSYDPKLGQVCLAALASIQGRCRVPVRELTEHGVSCYITPGSLTEVLCSFPCFGVARGTAQVGEACLSSPACEAPNWCNTQGICVAVLRVGEGEPCSSTPFSDGAIHECDYRLNLQCTGATGVCVKAGGEDGQPCRPPQGNYQPDPCARGFGCDGQICHPLRAGGAPCTAAWQCESQTCNGTCVDLGALEWESTDLIGWRCPQ